MKYWSNPRPWSSNYSRKRAPELLAIARKNGFRTMDQVGRNFMKNGIITHEEFVRTISLAD